MRLIQPCFQMASRGTSDDILSTLHVLHPVGMSQEFDEPCSGG